MPVGRVFNAAENQVLFSPVSNYYQGKAIRQQLAAGEQDAKLKDLQMKGLEQELADAPARKEAANKKAAADYDLVLESTRAKKLASGAAEMDAARDIVGPWVAEYDKRGIDWANENFEPLVLSRLPESKRVEFEKARGEDRAWNEDEMARVGLMIAVNEVDNDPDPTSHQKHLQSLVDQGFITQERANELLEAIEVKAGTVTGTTSLDPSASDVNASGISKNTVDFQETAIGAIGAVQMGTELLISADTNPEALGVPGGFIRWGANLVSGAKAMADWAGYEKLSFEETEKQTIGSGAFNYDKIDTDKLGVSGAEAEKFRAGVYGIAFAAAVSEQGTRPTDKDIQQFIDQIGGRATSAQSFRETIVQFMRRQDRRLKTIADVKSIGEVDREAALSAWKPAFNNFMNIYAKQTGKRIATNPDTGEQMIEISPENWESI